MSTERQAKINWKWRKEVRKSGVLYACILCWMFYADPGTCYACGEELLMYQKVGKKYEIPPETKPATCKGCGRAIYWVKTEAGKNMPCDPDGIPHWATCPGRDKFKGKGK